MYVGCDSVDGWWGDQVGIRDLYGNAPNRKILKLNGNEKWCGISNQRNESKQQQQQQQCALTTDILKQQTASSKWKIAKTKIARMYVPYNSVKKRMRILIFNTGHLPSIANQAPRAVCHIPQALAACRAITVGSSALA